MERSQLAIALALFISAISPFLGLVEANFARSTAFDFGAYHSSITNNGYDLQLTLDQHSGAGVQTKKRFFYGSFEMMIKLIPGNSAGTVTTFYLTSKVDDSVAENVHDEIDFEFLGNVSGQPYTMSTNIFTTGLHKKEQQFYLWFDPTADYHNYTIHWNPSQVVWFVDSIPIRVFRNYEKQGILYPNKQSMKMYATLWEASDWATRGGRDKVDWTKAPFIARYRNFKARACKQNKVQCAVQTKANWWTSPLYSQLSVAQRDKMKGIRDKYMIYDYCKDLKKFNGSLPGECSKPQY